MLPICRSLQNKIEFQTNLMRFLVATLRRSSYLHARPVIPDNIPVNFDDRFLVTTLRLSSQLFLILSNVVTDYGKAVNQFKRKK